MFHLRVPILTPILQNSQSQRILWLLEELAIPYNLKLYVRNESGPRQLRSPDELFEVDSLGRSPVLVTASGRVIVESGAIASYLIQTYDTAKKFQPAAAPEDPDLDWIRDEILTNFAGASFGPINVLQMFLEILTSQTPWLFRPLTRKLTGAIASQATTKEFQKYLTFLERELGERDYFMGKEPGRADFMLSYPMDMIAERNWVDMKTFPKLKAWRERCQSRPAWQQGLNKGNGYAWDFF